jgi:hypothetical protein
VVSRTVGFTVNPAITARLSNVFDAHLKITESIINCSYYQGASSTSSVPKTVTLTYITLSAQPPKSAAIDAIKAGFNKGLPKLAPGSKVSYTIGEEFGVTSLYAKISTTIQGQPFTVEFAYGWSGTKVAGAVATTALPTTTMNSLAKLALDNFNVT